MAHTDAQNRQSSFYEEVAGVDVYTIYHTNALWCATVRTDGRTPVDRTMLQRTKELASYMCLSMTLPRSGAHKPSASTLQYVRLLQLFAALAHSLRLGVWERLSHAHSCYSIWQAQKFGELRARSSHNANISHEHARAVLRQAAQRCRSIRAARGPFGPSPSDPAT